MIRARARALRPLLVLLLLGLFVAACTPGETGRYSLTLVTQQRHVVEDRQLLVGDTVVAGGTLVLAEGAEHRGSVTLLAGEVRVSGRVVGDLTVLGGEATLTATAEITGDAAAAGGTVLRDRGAVVRGSLTEEPGPGTVLQRSGEPRSPAEATLWFLVGIAIMTGLAWLTANLVPRPLERTQAAATGYPVVSGALGALALVTALPLGVTMVFTLFLIPVAGILLLALGGTAVFGLIALGRGVGIRVLRRLGRTWSTPRAAALGTAMLVTVLQLVGLVPLLGAAVLGLTVVVCVGAVLLTGFGLRWHTPPDDAVDRLRCGRDSRRCT